MFELELTLLLVQFRLFHFLFQRYLLLVGIPPSGVNCIFETLHRWL